MKLLLDSHVFSPEVGGIETASALLATEFQRLGHEVKVVTRTARADAISWPFEIVRCPAPSRLLGLLRWSEVFFQNNISLQSLWAALLLRKPWLVTHQTWITAENGTIGWRDRLKRRLLRFGRNVAISRAIADDLGVSSTIVGNPYDDRTFRLLPEIARRRELIFVGRLVSDKGLDLLVDALALLRREGLTPQLTIVGSGPEEGPLRRRIQAAGIDSQVTFAGQLREAALAVALNAHEIMVVPSRWAEPFGIVALEGIACGCVVLGSAAGGLPEAIGPCGVTFPNGEAGTLAERLRGLLADPARRAALRAPREEHLAHFQTGAVARRYLELFAQIRR